MNILLTGYSSKIGLELINYLSDLKHEIFFLGRQPTPNYPENHWISWALGTKPDLTRLPSIDILIHIAWLTKSRYSNYHINVGGTAQLFEEKKLNNARIIFLSSISAINPKSYYGLSKREIEVRYRNTKLEILRPGLVLGAESYTKKIKRVRIIPGAKTQVHITHLECLIPEIVSAVQNPKESSRNLICQTTSLSKLIAKNSWYLPLPASIFKRVLNFLIFSEKGSDLKDSYDSLISTPNLVVKACCRKYEQNRTPEKG